MPILLQIEDEYHVLLECDTEDLSALRETFRTEATAVLPQILWITHALPTNAAMLDILLTREMSLHTLARFNASVFELREDTPCLNIRNDNTLLVLDH
ncbi:hypothetical protein TRAPUB_13396 [Trametes pubescens]|uniref:Uncharacterized protein n=1 Tax=Trametes pubescens TaxID=154538 RepID=A0A1M2VRB2_TRAPU|nr:hypothetical protein TRAPUB_13396 [Trametes pubescens]